MSAIILAGRAIGPDEPPLIIAEVGINHEGEFDKAIELVDAAVEARAECVKFQCHITEAEMLDPGLADSDLLYRLFHEDGVRLFRQRPLRHGCRCSRDKVAATLGSFARAEVEDMAENGAVTVTCEFCKEDYVFDEAALAELFAP